MGFPLDLGLPLGLGFALGLGLRFRGLFSPSFLVLLGGAGGLPGGGGAFPGSIGGLAGGAFLGLFGGLGGGGGTLSAMTILCWQPEGLFERIGDMMSFIKNYAGYLINEIHGIGASFSIAPKPSSSITNKLEITSPPNLLHNLTHASTVPPVAKRSSIIIIF